MFYRIKVLIGSQLIKNWNVIIGKRAVTQWKRWLGIMTALWLLTIVLIIIWPFKTGNADNPETLYLLSALAQSLAAIFALIFTITLVVAQLTSRYSHRIISSFFDRYVMLYICVFLGSILLAIFILNNPIPFLIKLSIITGTLSLYLLIPFLLRIKEQLNPYHIIDKLKLEAEAKLNHDPAIEPDEILTIDNFIMSSFVLKDYDTFGHGIKTLTELAIKQINATSNKEDNGSSNVIFSIINKISEVGLVTLDDPRAPFQIINSLFEIARYSMDRNLDLLSSSTINGLSRIGKKAAQSKLTEILRDNIPNDVLSRLYFIGQSGINHKLENTVIASGIALGDIGMAAANNSIEDIIITNAASNIRQIIQYAITHRFRKTSSGTDIVSSLTYQLGRIGIESTKNSLQEPAGWVATFLCHVSELALDNNLRSVSIEATNSLGVMGRISCEKNLVVALESITSCLYGIGKKSVDTIDLKTFENIPNNFRTIIVEGNKNGLDQIVLKSSKYLYKLATFATINRYRSFQEILLESLEPLHNKLGFVDIGYQQVRTEFTNQPDYLKALEEFTLLLKA